MKMDELVDRNILILTKMFEQALTESQASAAVNRIVADLIATFDSIPEKKLSDNKPRFQLIFEAANLALANLEQLDEAKTIIAILKKNGLYRMLYRHPKTMGVQDTILPIIMRGGFIGVGIAAVITLVFACSLIFGAPFWLTATATGLFIGASAYLSGLLYGVINDLFATKANLPYFLLGHLPRQHSILKTNDRVAQAIAWGVTATTAPVGIFAIGLIIAGLITAFANPMATSLLPVLMLVMPIIAIGAEFFARLRTRAYNKNPEWCAKTLNQELGWYPLRGLVAMYPRAQDKATWFANNDRNLFGYLMVSSTGIAALIILITTRDILPNVFFSSPLLSVYLPVAFAGFAVLALGAAGLYTYMNRERHIDDRYNLEFRENKYNVDFDLYLKEDKDYVDGLIKTTDIRFTSLYNSKMQSQVTSSTHSPNVLENNSSSSNNKIPNSITG